MIVNMFLDAPWPGNILSNFASTPFVIDDVYCTCSEAFIQSLKLADAVEQKKFCLLEGQAAWGQGSKLTDIVFGARAIWWRGNSYPSHSVGHYQIVKRGLTAKFMQSEQARHALLATGDAVLTHDYGQVPGKKQSLPVEVFCQIVTEIRCELSQPH